MFLLFWNYKQYIINSWKYVAANKKKRVWCQISISRKNKFGLEKTEYYLTKAGNLLRHIIN